MKEDSQLPKGCARCGKPLATDAPQGLCAACLLLAGVETISQSSGDAPTLWGGDRSADEALRLSPGQTWGQYRIGRLLGRGGMGEVYEAEDAASGRRLALKVLRSRFQNPEERARFLREGQMAASVSHPHTVYIFGSEEIGNTPVISMELAPGGTLKDRVASQGPLAPVEAVSAILDIIGGLDAAQSAGILHRDIKPSNCFLDRDGSVKVGDFGLSISTLARDVEHDVATTGFQGTPQFAAPEQLRGAPLDVRADIYAVGATLYYLLTGRPPFDARDWRELAGRVANEPPRSPRHWRRDIPSGLAAIVLRCLAKDPAGRPASYAALAESLQPFSSSGYVAAGLGVRFLAGIADSVILTFTFPLFATLMGNPLIPTMLSSDTFSMVEPSASLWTISLLVVYFLLEGYTGATPGKHLFGLRVRSADGGVASWAQMSVRHLVFDAPSLLLLAPLLLFEAADVNAFVEANPELGFVTSAGSLVIFGLYFVTARRHNGWAAIHDLLSGTRLVVVRRHQPRLWRPSAESTAISVEVPSPAAQQYGPYRAVSVIGELEDGQLLAGFDPALRRRVWIRTLPTGAPEIGAARRDASRKGRLHWLTGRRSDEENWDAFEAPDGAPFLTQQHPAPWPVLKMWLLELVNELQASVREGTLPRLSLSRIWVRNDGHLVLLDSPVFVSSSAVRAQEDLNPVRVLSLVAARGLSRNMEDGVPLTARSMIESWSGSMPPAIEGVRSSLMQVSSSLDRVHRWRRLVTVVFTLVPFLFGAGSLYFVRTEIARVMTPEKYEMVGLLNWLAFSSELLREPEFRIALERYLAARHAAALRDDQFWRGPAGLAYLTLRQTGLDIVARYPSVSAEELSQASAVVEPKLKDLQEELEMPVAEEIGLLLVFVTFFVVGWSLISSAIVPGGFVMRALGLALVTADGRAAGRARSVARTLVAWLPGMGWILWFMYCLGTGKTEAIGSWLAMVIAFLPLIAGAIWTIAYPSRGFHDRVVGTWVVPR